MQPRGFAVLAVSAAIAGGCSSAQTSPADGGAGDATTDVADAGAGDTAPVGAGLDWSCLGSVTYPPATVPTIKVDFTSFENLSNKPLVGAAVKACARTDTACATGLGTATTDDKGIVSFPALPTGTVGFDGYFAVSYPGDSTNLNFVSPPLIADLSTYFRVYWGYTSFAVALASAGVTQDPARGIVGIEAQDCGGLRGGKPCTGQTDCRGRIAAGVSFELDVVDPAIKRVYLDASSTKLSATATMTDDTGKGGFANVPPGPATVTAKVAATGKTIGKQTLFVRAGTPSMLVLSPTP